MYAKYIYNNDIDKQRKNLKFCKGSWALITGSTDGIGKAYSLCLARLGFNIILIGRSQEKLMDTKEMLQNDERVKKIREIDNLNTWDNKEWVQTGLLDFSVDDYKVVDKVIGSLIQNHVTGIVEKNLKVVVNNAGVSYDYPIFFMDLPGEYQISQNMVNVNVMSTLNVTIACLKRMKLPRRSLNTSNTDLEVDKELLNFQNFENSKGGTIINVSSFSALNSTPCLTVYAATKAFIKHFSACLNAELKNTAGVIVQTVMPYFVVTKMTKLKRVTLLHPSPEVYVQNSLKMVGLQTVTFGYWPHSLMALLNKTAYYLSPWIAEKIILSVFTSNLRKREQRGLRQKK
ncbi:unnamed protein product [Gordionus sp. m RMFG-2023]